MILIVDSWVWIEIASGTERAQECLKRIKGKELYTSILNL